MKYANFWICVEIYIETGRLTSLLVSRGKQEEEKEENVKVTEPLLCSEGGVQKFVDGKHYICKQARLS